MISASLEASLRPSSTGHPKTGSWSSRAGDQMAEMRTTAGVTQAELAAALGVSQARISKIEHGEISGIDVVRAYVAALGGSIDVLARLGDRSWKVA